MKRKRLDSQSSVAGTNTKDKRQMEEEDEVEVEVEVEGLHPNFIAPNFLFFFLRLGGVVAGGRTHRALL